jgi:branched-chain amino acid transport system substrate-binding protein
MERRVIMALTAAGALVVAGCSSSSTTSSASTSGASAATTSCVASIGMEGVLTGPVAVVGQEQLHFAELALASDNLANKTNITLVQGDTQLGPAEAVTVTQQFTSNPKIVAVVGPVGSQQVEAVGPLMARAGMALISGSATNAALTTGKYPTFFRTVSKDSVQGPQDASYIVKNLHPKALMIVDDQEAYSTGLVSAMVPIFGTDGLFSPATFTIAGSYVSSFGPDIIAIPADAAIARAALQNYGSFGTWGPPTFAATHVVDEAIASGLGARRSPNSAGATWQRSDDHEGFARDPGSAAG